MGIPYTGSGVMASALGMDKWRSKLLWQAAGLPVPGLRDARRPIATSPPWKRLGLPLFVKPACEGSSIGITQSQAAGRAGAAYAAAAKHDSLVIAERAILGGEYTVAILGDQALPIIKIEPSNEFYDYEAKYLRDDTAYRCPCGLRKPVRANFAQQALEAFRDPWGPRLGTGRFPDGPGGNGWRRRRPTFSK
jgi:D-alanine-D-alanine ligase